MVYIAGDLINKIREIANNNPEHIHTDECLYVVGGQPGCIVGQAAWQLGWIDEEYETQDTNSEAVSYFLHDLNVRALHSDAEWLHLVQKNQDSGKSWGYAVTQADEWRESYR